MVDPMRIILSSNAAMQGSRALDPPDPHRQARQVREEDQLQLSTESEQVTELKSGLDVAEGQDQRASIVTKQHQDKKTAGDDVSPSPEGQDRDAGKRLDVQG
mgnify:CR=1 FL=1